MPCHQQSALTTQQTRHPPAQPSLLRGETAPDISVGSAGDNALAGRTPPIIDAKAETIDGTDRPLFGAATSARPNRFGVLRALSDRVRRRSGLGFQGLLRPAPVSTPDIVPAGGKFLEATYSNPAGTRAYKLYIPSRYHGQALPLVVMLHGCTQSPDDFAAGTRMNLIAEEQTCFVVYPAQPSEANPAKCWNWFRPSDQRRGQGEPSLIAGITRQVMRDYSVDPQRVYIGGLSAGAAAAAVMGVTYPDLYAAIGVHSGLAWGPPTTFPLRSPPCGKAAWQLLPGPATCRRFWERAGGANHRFSRRSRHHSASAQRRSCHRAVDRTTNLRKTVHRGRVPGGHAYTRTIHTDGSGRAILEHWEIHGAGHAWSGGAPLAPTPIREGRTPRGRCCVSSSTPGAPRPRRERCSNEDKIYRSA